VGRDAKRRKIASIMLCFNPRAHVGRDRRIQLQLPAYLRFQSTRPRGARRQTSEDHAGLHRFQSTRPRGARRLQPEILREVQKFQSTRPRGARLLHYAVTLPPIGVSIHAPTWGATLRLSLILVIYKVSIHAPTWGATLHPHAHHLHNRRFNPRAHVGRDAGHQLIPLRRQKVSIHAPTWGATPLMVIACGVEPVSIHAPTWGATQASMPSPVPNISFNPRAHVGRDRWDSLNSVCCYVSIHAPTWGATLMPFSKRSFSLLFQSTRPRGARPLPFASVDSGIGFNPRAHVGRDPLKPVLKGT